MKMLQYMAQSPENRPDLYIPPEDDWGEPPSTSSAPAIPEHEEVSDIPQAIRPPNMAFLVIALIAALVVFGLVIKAALDRDDEYNKLRPESEELDVKRGDYK
ncbi:MAG: hypothetical protein ACYTDT_02660 [Planctomycetota bacterium]|jgi:hypothetical protein